MIELEEKYKNILNGCKFIDLFCGIGGFHLALASFGAECVFASDIDKEAKKVYKENFGMEPAGDITKIKPEQIPAHDIICAGFPCQPFSISGDQKGFDDNLGRGKLFFNIVEIAKVHHPQFILLENVKNFEKHDKGNTLKTVEGELRKVGYSVFSKVLCAADYGVPQARQRIYIVAFRSDLAVTSFQFPDSLKDYKTLDSILIEDKKNEVIGNYYINRNYTIKAKSVERKNALIRIGQIGLGRQGERIYSINGLSTTLSSQGGGLGGKTGMYLINGRVRKLYPRECARLMGFPDNYKLASSQEKCYNQFGNSVVVDVLQYITIKIIEKLQEDNHE